MKTQITVEPIAESSVTSVCLFQMAAMNNSGCLDYSFEEMCNEIESFSTFVTIQRDDEIQRVTVFENDEPLVILHFKNILPDFPTTPKIKKDEQY